MHHLLAVLGLATALVAPPTRRQTTRLRAASLPEKKGDDYIFEDIAKNLGKGDQDRLYQYQQELAERYGRGQDRPRGAAAEAQEAEAGGTVVVEAVTPPTTRLPSRRATQTPLARPRMRRGGGAVLDSWVLEYLISVRTKALALEKSLEALIVAVAAPATDAVGCVWRRRARLRIGLRLRRRRRGRCVRRRRARLRQGL